MLEATTKLKLEVDLMDRLTRQEMNQKPVVTDLLLIVTGSFLSAVAFNSLLIPNQLLSGGLGGVAVLFHYLSGWRTSVIYFVLNIPIFLLGMRYIGRRFITYSLVGAISFAVLLAVTRIFPAPIDDPLLGGILGGFLHGLGAGIVFRARGSTGGIDVIAVGIKKWRGYSLGQVTLAFNVLLMIIFGMIFNLTLAAYTLISMYITTRVIDAMETGLDEARSVTIVSAKADLISRLIISRMHRGVTYLEGAGAYSGEHRQIILCVVNPTELPNLKDIVFRADNQAFIIVADVREVVGRGFKVEPFEY